MSGVTYTVVATDVALPPPPGVTPCFDDPFSLRPYHNVAASLGLLFAGFFLILRIWTKVAVVKQVRWEDYTCCIGFLFYGAWSAMQFEVINGRGGTHQWNVKEMDLQKQYRFTNYSDILYSVSIAFTKFSIILLVLRVFCPKIRDMFYWLLQLLNLLNTSFYIVFFFIPIFACNPRQKIWDKKAPGTCMNVYVLYVSSGTFNTVSDCLMFFVPLWRIWNLAISRSRKLGLSAIFTSGALAIISSIFRLYYCVLLLTKGQTLDFSYVKAQSAIWTHGELAFGIMSSCLFVLPRLYRHIAAIPPFGSDEYDEYQRRKESHTQSGDPNDFRLRKASRQSLGGPETDIERPSVPNLRPLAPWKDDSEKKGGGELRPQYSPDRVWKGHFMTSKKSLPKLPISPPTPKRRKRSREAEEGEDGPDLSANIPSAEEINKHNATFYTAGSPSEGEPTSPAATPQDQQSRSHNRTHPAGGLDRTVGWNSSFAPPVSATARRHQQQRRFPCPLRSPTTEMSQLESGTRFGGGSEYVSLRRPMAGRKGYDFAEAKASLVDLEAGTGGHGGKKSKREKKEIRPPEKKRVSCSSDEEGVRTGAIGTAK